MQSLAQDIKKINLEAFITDVFIHDVLSAWPGYSVQKLDDNTLAVLTFINSGNNDYGLQIIDISDPVNPFVINKKQYDLNTIIGSDIAPDGLIFYVFDFNNIVIQFTDSAGSGNLIYYLIDVSDRYLPKLKYKLDSGLSIGDSGAQPCVISSDIIALFIYNGSSDGHLIRLLKLSTDKLSLSILNPVNQLNNGINGGINAFASGIQSGVTIDNNTLALTYIKEVSSPVFQLGIAIINITDRTTPVLLNSNHLLFNVVEFNPTSTLVSTNVIATAYKSSNNKCEIVIYDVSDRVNPAIFNSINRLNGSIGTGNDAGSNHSINKLDNTTVSVILSDSANTSSRSEINIIDISDPTTPVILNSSNLDGNLVSSSGLHSSVYINDKLFLIETDSGNTAGRKTSFFSIDVDADNSYLTPVVLNTSQQLDSLQSFSFASNFKLKYTIYAEDQYNDIIAQSDILICYRPQTSPNNESACLKWNSIPGAVRYILSGDYYNETELIPSPVKYIIYEGTKNSFTHTGALSNLFVLENSANVSSFIASINREAYYPRSLDFIILKNGILLLAIVNDSNRIIDFTIIDITDISTPVILNPSARLNIASGYEVKLLEKENGEIILIKHENTTNDIILYSINIDNYVTPTYKQIGSAIAGTFLQTEALYLDNNILILALKDDAIANDPIVIKIISIHDPNSFITLSTLTTDFNPSIKFGLSKINNNKFAITAEDTITATFDFATVDITDVSSPTINYLYKNSIYKYEQESAQSIVRNLARIGNTNFTSNTSSLISIDDNFIKTLYTIPGTNITDGDIASYDDFVLALSGTDGSKLLIKLVLPGNDADNNFSLYEVVNSTVAVSANILCKFINQRLLVIIHGDSGNLDVNFKIYRIGYTNQLKKSPSFSNNKETILNKPTSLNEFKKLVASSNAEIDFRNQGRIKRLPTPHTDGEVPNKLYSDNNLIQSIQGSMNPDSYFDKKLWVLSTGSGVSIVDDSASGASKTAFKFTASGATVTLSIGSQTKIFGTYPGEVINLLSQIRRVAGSGTPEIRFTIHFWDKDLASIAITSAHYRSVISSDGILTTTPRWYSGAVIAPSTARWYSLEITSAGTYTNDTMYISAFLNNSKWFLPFEIAADICAYTAGDEVERIVSGDNGPHRGIAGDMYYANRVVLATGANTTATMKSTDKFPFQVKYAFVRANTQAGNVSIYRASSGTTNLMTIGTFFTGSGTNDKIIVAKIPISSYSTAGQARMNYNDGSTTSYILFGFGF